MRADKFLAEKFGSRTKAAEEIARGTVKVNGKVIRAKDEINDGDEISFESVGERFVSNGGYKLAKALDAFSFDCKNLVFADFGASTGGFCDCLLQHGAKSVYAVDVGESLLHESIAARNEIFVMDNTNARNLTSDDFSEKIDCVTGDLSFISLKLIFPAVSNVLSGKGNALFLIKPQFECEKKGIGKSGIVHLSEHTKIVKKVLSYVRDNALFPVDIVNAPIRKGKNIEYVLLISAQKGVDDERILNKVKTIVDSVKDKALE